MQCSAHRQSFLHGTLNCMHGHFSELHVFLHLHFFFRLLQDGDAFSCVIHSGCGNTSASLTQIHFIISISQSCNWCATQIYTKDEDEGVLVHEQLSIIWLRCLNKYCWNFSHPMQGTKSDKETPQTCQQYQYHLRGCLNTMRAFKDKINAFYFVGFVFITKYVTVRWIKRL